MKACPLTGHRLQGSKLTAISSRKAKLVPRGHIWRLHGLKSVWSRSRTEQGRSDFAFLPIAATSQSKNSFSSFQILGTEHSEEVVWTDSRRTSVCSSDSPPNWAISKRVTIRDTKGNIVDSKVQDVLSWTKRIWKFTKAGQCRDALKFYEEMQEGAVRPNSYTFVAVLKACSQLQDFETCRHIHVHIIDGGLESHEFVADMLLATNS